ncbi:MAG TPA: GAF domain-containing protein [Candidatus Limnocylindria bacterium]|nr:GAF domain-containing protein [Candidatus Limnocylindria bacterium]
MPPESNPTERRLQRLEALHNVTKVIYSTLDQRESLQRILGEAVRLTGATSGSLCLVNPTTGFLEIEAAAGLPANARSLRLKIGEGITGWVARTGQSVRVVDVSRDNRYFSLNRDVQCEMAVPLRVADEVRGVLNVDSNRVEAFSENDLELLNEIAGLAAPAIQNTWLYESVRQKARLLESLVKVGQLINSTFSVDDALQIIAREARALMRGKMVSLMMLDQRGEWLDVRAHNNAGPGYLSKPRLSVAESLVGIVVRRRKSLQVENVQISGRYQNVAVARKEGLVSLLSVPLLFERKAIGILNVYTGDVHTFSDEEVRILTAYAELSALAIEKARLYDRIVSIEEALRQSERLSALGLLAAEVAHEIRNPLTVMKMLHHSLDLNFKPTDPRAMDFRIMGEKMDHLNRIVDKVLDFARGTEPQLTEVNINQLLDDMTMLTRVKLRNAGVEMKRKLDPRLPNLLADATQLEQAFLNLTLNAVEAMPDGGTLTIASRPLPIGAKDNYTHVLVRFRDTGVGMTREQRERAFSSLLQTTKPQGTGLGMAIVARVVETHDGEVRLYSQPGKGTAINIILPVAR